MRYILLFLLVLFANLYTFSQEITRGPEPGEIYFMGPTTTVLYDAIYRSTDFGETAICMDSVSALTNNIGSIAADKTPGGLYFSNWGEGLYYSNNYGNYGDWIYRTNGYFSHLCSGMNEGFIFEGCWAHSEDYGITFIDHNLNGFFGGLLSTDITENSKGYAITHKYSTDSLCFFVSDNNFNDNQLRHVFTYLGYGSGFYFISSAHDSYGIYFYNFINKELWYSNDDGYNWTLKNTFTCPNLPIKGITGGRQAGELYLLVEYLQYMGYVRHTYIYHSLDYGETFTIHHPIAIGNDPSYANFEAIDTLGKAPLEVQFTDLSNNPTSWEWDFNNDGIIDSYEQNPTYIYEDTGYYAVRLDITSNSELDYATRHNYIHVTTTTGLNAENVSTHNRLKIYPNPFQDQITIDFSKSEIPETIKIFDINGKLVKRIDKSKSKNQIVWDGRDGKGGKCKPGVYYIVSEVNSQTLKIVLME